MTKILGYYPYGAIPRSDLIKVGDTIFRVLALGSRSALQTLHIKRFEHDNGSTFLCGVNEKNHPDHFSMLDSNVNILNGYNMHYIFHDRDLAEDYFAWAKRNTPQPESTY